MTCFIHVKYIKLGHNFLHSEVFCKEISTSYRRDWNRPVLLQQKQRQKQSNLTFVFLLNDKEISFVFLRRVKFFDKRCGGV